MRMKGFTLLELLIVLTIAGVLYGVVVPSMHHLVGRFRLHTATANMEKTLHLAKSEALARHAAVRLCPSRDGEWCDSSADYANGWIVYIDASKNANHTTRTAADKIIRVQSALSGMSVCFNPNGDAGNGCPLSGKKMMFNAQGRFGLLGSIHFCPDSDSIAPLRLVVIHSGRIRVAADNIRCARG